MQPGDVRVLGMEEKSQLYRACVPWLEGAHERRIHAMEAARKARIERPIDRSHEHRETYLIVGEERTGNE